MLAPTAQANTVEICVSGTAQHHFHAYGNPIAASGPVPGPHSASALHDPVIVAVAQFPRFDAEWFGVVQQRIIASTSSDGYSKQGDFAWLQPQVSSAAIDFFKHTSSVLPGEPYIYSSSAGDLVAEFEASKGKMTCVISPEFVLIFAVTDDDVIERKLAPGQYNSAVSRADIQSITSLLTLGTNGPLEAQA